MSDLSPQRSQSVSLCDALDRVLETGVVVLGEAKISVADVDLVYLGLQLVVTSIENGGDRATDGLANRAWPTDAGDADRPAGKDAPPAPPEESNVVAQKGSDQPPPLAATTAAEGSPTAAEDSPSANGSGPDETPAKKPEQGLGQLVLTVIKLLHDLLERQALRRIEGDSLDAAQVERLGVTLMQQAEAIEKLRLELGLQTKDLNLDLGPLGKLL